MLDSALITCALTGNITRPDQTPHLPISPEQIARSALEAAQAGAAIVHIHVRDPQTGAPSMATTLYREVIERIRQADSDVIINLTTGPGGRFVPSREDPKLFGPGTTLMEPERRVEHIALLKPDISTLDLNTMNSGAQVVINTPENVRRMARVIRDSGVRPEIELFDSGDIALLNDLIGDGTLEPSPLCSIVMGVKYGFLPSPETLLYARGLLPPKSIWTGFGLGRMAFPMVAQSLLAGGHVRVGMEDTVYISRGQLAPSNAALVAKARNIMEALGVTAMTSRQARELLGLRG